MAWLLRPGVLLVLIAAAQDTGRRGIALGDFSVADAPCSYQHDAAVERALRIDIGADKGTLELHNHSRKTITAYVFNYTVRRDGRTSHYRGIGEDLVYEMALGGRSLPPGGIHRKQIRPGGTGGWIEAFPCLAVFEDGTAIGPPALLEFLAAARSDSAKLFATLVSDLEAARESENPRAVLTSRARQLKNGSRARYLETVAAELSGSRNDAKVLAGHIHGLRAQQAVLSEQARIVRR